MIALVNTSIKHDKNILYSQTINRKNQVLNDHFKLQNREGHEHTFYKGHMQGYYTEKKDFQPRQ